MENYYEASLDLKINNKAPKELMDKLVDMQNDFISEPYVTIEPILTEENNSKIIEYIDYSILKEANKEELSKDFEKFLTEMGYTSNNYCYITIYLINNFIDTI